MHTFISWIQSLAERLGPVGLFIVAFLDSSFLSLPQINDLLVVLMVTRSPYMMPVYVTMATLGSLAGCMVMYYIGRKGGDAVLRKRFRAARVERALQLFERYGVLAVIVPALLPPPAPFKIFVMLAGAARMSPVKFWVAIAIGRGLRYVVMGALAVWFGQRALAFIEAHSRQVSLAVGLLVLAGGIGYAIWRSRRSRGEAASEGAG